MNMRICLGSALSAATTLSASTLMAAEMLEGVDVNYLVLDSLRVYGSLGLSRTDFKD